MSRFIFVILLPFLAAFFIGCGDTDNTFTQRLSFDFFDSPQGWQSGFAGLPPDSEESYELDADWLPLPEPLDTTRNALFISGNNQSDGLFMFYKQRFIGLSPGQEVRIRYQIEFASNMPEPCEVQPEPVFLKAGASNVEPRAILQQENQGQILRMNIDVDEAADVLGNITDIELCSDENQNGLELKGLETPEDGGIIVSADESGAIWLFLGIDSGFEGITSAYFSFILISITSV
ncbi:MAG: hypothetical protein ACFCU6_01395 [Balneolaceae bacterium]